MNAHIGTTYDAYAVDQRYARFSEVLRRHAISGDASFWDLQCHVCRRYMVNHACGPSWKAVYEGRTIALISTLMWTLALTHVILTLKLALDSFVDDAHGLESMYDALTYQSLWFHSRLGRTRFVIYVTQTLIGNAFMIFRVFIVWGGRSTIIAIPALFVVSDAVAGYMSIDVAFSAFMPLVFFCLSFFTNVLCSGALSLFSASVNLLN
ncbi:hypothetical protein NUW54_g7040 [Trametes sanguinea]|uniref:Uncharacterized protein n=1 Tax=Trametes sanguinea TaxID=158606 RepID=A0ACC1PRJ7_9APHY|nr:hypothetical protein NUW54_g7040 [Trametes sanguinea]